MDIHKIIKLHHFFSFIQQYNTKLNKYFIIGALNLRTIFEKTFL